MDGRLKAIFKKHGAANAGWTPVSELGTDAGEKWAKGLFCAVFPYFESLCPGNISIYARGMDYHTALKSRLTRAAAELEELYPHNRFKIYVDASPYPEVRASALCGLGVFGQNGLLITEDYGSYVFIGTIASDLVLEHEKTEIKSCIKCMACVRACPGGALDGGFNINKCLSHITQKKGELSLDEQRAVERGGMAWGCDVCQRVCPLNAGVKGTYLPEFSEGLICSISREQLNISQREFKRRYGDRAFSWRGAGPLKRNMNILKK